MNKITEILAGSLCREAWMDMEAITLASLTIVTQVAAEMWNLHWNKAEGKILKTFGTAMREHALTLILLFCEYELDLLNWLSIFLPQPFFSSNKTHERMSPPAKCNDLFLSQKFKFSPIEAICLYKERAGCVLYGYFLSSSINWIY